MRLRLRESGPAGYFNSFPLNAAMDEILTVGEVVESRAEGFAPGDAVTHAWGWRDYAVVKAGEPSLGGVGTLAHARHLARAAGEVPRRRRQHGA